MSSYQLNADDLAAMTAILIARYEQERGKTITRLRLARATVRGMANRTKLHETLVMDWIDKLARDYGWATFEIDDEFILIRIITTRQWTRIAAYKRLKAIVDALHGGNRKLLDEAMDEIQPYDDDEYDDESLAA